ncbi:class I SAM-dependent methyltransferase [Bythopirellula goksoeyrii]|uniref:dTDP-3-amino-3,4, 6-trideoxy-alpha-D-glucopyranose n=1 Tax=Bythopirellula goksoeyrii TaxID=1400387 RepID=A0A5B9QGG9_9BACT|nr:class I SAM-dependent methyltransferase [Bythopirellula goksoeyrii]QEG33363.1 dTDP-3-amino-3,4,6-trideoxy-alpha-D-glucopyranose [Bythopirellula goksoeyrii]
MLPTTQASLYDFPKYYDLVYGSDWKAEFDFLLECFAQHATGKVKRVFEPACGTGRLMVKLAQAGFKVAGVDLNEAAVKFCNDRLERSGYPRSAFVGDMCNFTVSKPFDAAFNPINSFRHLGTQAQAEQHLHTVAKHLRPGGIYVLGLHLTPTVVEPMQEESWSARRGNLAVLSRLWVTACDRRRRREEVGMSFDVYTPTKQFRIEDQVVFRTYSAQQMKSLLASVPEFEVTQVYDFGYDIQQPITVGPETEDVVYVLRKKSR